MPAQSPNSADNLPQGHSLRPRGQTRTRLQALEVSSDEEAEGISEPEVDDEDTHGVAEISSTMEKVGLAILRPSWLQDYTTPLLLVCRACLKGINIQNSISHVTGKEDGGHCLRVRKEIIIELKEWIKWKAHLFLSSTTAFRDAPSSAYTPRALPILKVFENALQCTSKECSHCCLRPNAMATHWSQEHRGKRTKTKSKTVAVQTFFESHPRYFIVNPHLSGLPANSLYELYERQLVPEMEEECEQVVPYLASEREIPPLLKIMQWHQHLAPYLLDEATDSEISSHSSSNGLPLFNKRKIESLLSVIDFPKRRSGVNVLRDVVQTYLLGIKTECQRSEPRIRRMLMQCPLK